MEKLWADQPFELIPIPGVDKSQTCNNPEVLEIAADMANVHNVLLRSLNSIYLQCGFVRKPEDIADLVTYIHAWTIIVGHHHQGEEEFMFPEFNKVAEAGGAPPGLLDQNVAQHAEFEPGLHALRNFTSKTREGKEEFDSKKLKKVIDGFAPALALHLRDEIKTLLMLEKYDGPALRKIYEAVIARGMKGIEMSFVLPLIFGAADKTQLGGKNFPPIPFFFPYLCKYVFERKYRGAWRFNPCDSWSRPRNLMFLE